MSRRIYVELRPNCRPSGEDIASVALLGAARWGNPSGSVSWREVCVCHVHQALHIPQPTASRHLAQLRKAGLVVGRRDGTWVHYRLADWHPLGDVLAQVRTVLREVPEVAEDRRRLRALACHEPAAARPASCNATCE